MRKLTITQWSAIKDYCDGKRLRGISDKYKCHDGHIVTMAKQIGITPRPTGFASYEIAHMWVLNARLEFKKIYDSVH